MTERELIQVGKFLLGMFVGLMLVGVGLAAGGLEIDQRGEPGSISPEAVKVAVAAQLQVAVPVQKSWSDLVKYTQYYCGERDVYRKHLQKGEPASTWLMDDARSFYAEAVEDYNSIRPQAEIDLPRQAPAFKQMIDKYC